MIGGTFTTLTPAANVGVLNNENSVDGSSASRDDNSSNDSMVYEMNEGGLPLPEIGSKEGFYAFYADFFYDCYERL